MGWYARAVFPYLCDFLLKKHFLWPFRQELLAGVTGNVLEIGFGTGLNLPHYPSSVRELSTVDSNVGMHRLARSRIAHSPIQVHHHVAQGEQLPFDAGTFDSVVSTFTLCSIDDAARALRETHRVLRSGGRFLFLEHGLHPNARVQRWQRRLNWLEGRLGGGCHLDRDMRQLVTAAPFATTHIEDFDLLQFPKTHGRLYRGIAVKE